MTQDHLRELTQYRTQAFIFLRKYSIFLVDTLHHPQTLILQQYGHAQNGVRFVVGALVLISVESWIRVRLWNVQQRLVGCHVPRHALVCGEPNHAADALGHARPQLSLIFVQNETRSTITLQVLRRFLDDVVQHIIQRLRCGHVNGSTNELLHAHQGLKELLVLSNDLLQLLKNEEDLLVTTTLENLYEFVLVCHQRG